MSITDWWHSTKQDFTRKAIWDLFKLLLIFVCVSASSVFSWSLLSSIYVGLTPFRWPLLVVFLSVSLLLTAIIYEKLNRFRPAFPRLQVDFLILEKYVEYRYQDRANMTYVKRLRLKALRRGIDTYRDKYRWTSDGPMTITSSHKDQQFLEIHKRNVWQYYEIRFQKPLAKGEVVETELKWELHDPEHKAVPFFSADIEEPTNRLIMHLSLDPSLGVTSAIQETSPSIGAPKSLRSDSVSLNSHGELTWVIPNPSLLYHYEMRWYFQED